MACFCRPFIMMSASASQITGVSIVCSIICSGADQRKHQSSASLASMTGLCEGKSPVTSGFPSQRPLAWKMFSFDDVIRIKHEGVCPVEHPDFIHLWNDKLFTWLPANMCWKLIYRISPFAWPNVSSSANKPKPKVLAQILSHSSFFQGLLFRERKW